MPTEEAKNITRRTGDITAQRIKGQFQPSHHRTAAALNAFSKSIRRIHRYLVNKLVLGMTGGRGENVQPRDHEVALASQFNHGLSNGQTTRIQMLFNQAQMDKNESSKQLIARHGMGGKPFTLIGGSTAQILGAATSGAEIHVPHEINDTSFVMERTQEQGLNHDLAPIFMKEIAIAHTLGYRAGESRLRMFANGQQQKSVHTFTISESMRIAARGIVEDAARDVNHILNFLESPSVTNTEIKGKLPVHFLSDMGIR